MVGHRWLAPDWESSERPEESGNRQEPCRRDQSFTRAVYGLRNGQTIAYFIPLRL